MKANALPALFGMAIGALLMIAVLPGAGAAVAHAISQNPTMLFGILVAIGIPAAIYALMRYEDGEANAPRAEAPAANVLGDIRVELERQFAQFQDLVREQLKSSEQHSNAIDHLNGRLNGSRSEVELQAIIQKLIQSNDAYRRETAALEHRLDLVQRQADALKQRATKAERLACIDPLTSVANRRKFDEELERQVALSHQDETPLCLVMVDIDHFKSINDRFGHRTGDAVLVQFAELIVKSVRTTDFVARYGGEEFAVILPRTPLGNAYEIAERIRCAMQSQVWKNTGDAKISLTSSFGISDVQDGDKSVDLVDRTDQMLYEAKRRGRNRTMITRSAA
jgi:diguanylate cyclase